MNAFWQGSSHITISPDINKSEKKIVKTLSLLKQCLNENQARCSPTTIKARLRSGYWVDFEHICERIFQWLTTLTGTSVVNLGSKSRLCQRKCVKTLHFSISTSIEHRSIKRLIISNISYLTRQTPFLVVIVF